MKRMLFIVMRLALVIGLTPVAGVFAQGSGPACEPLEVRLLAGQHMEVGSVIVANDADELCVTYALNADALAAGWLIYGIHLAVEKEFADIPQTRANWWGTNPIPGQFVHKPYFLEGVPSHTICIPLDELGVDFDEDVFIAAHAVIIIVDEFGYPLYDETAWGEGERFNQRGNWGMWFSYTLCYPVEMFELTMSVIGDGQATGAGLYAAGTVVDIVATPDPGNIFQFWSAPAGAFGDEFAEVTTFMMPAEDVTVTARFMPEGEYDERFFDHGQLCVEKTGGVGIIVDFWDISALADGTVLDFYFHALTQPDRWTIWYGGEVVFSSGWVSTNPDYWSGQPLFSAEGVQYHYWHPNVAASTWRTWGGPYPEGGLYASIITKDAGKGEVVIRTEGGEPGTVWYYKLCAQ